MNTVTVLTQPTTVVQIAPRQIQVIAGRQQTEVVTTGTQGPPGPAGAAAVAFEFVQSFPGEQWIINHNLGVKPSIELIDDGGAEMDAEIIHVSINQVIVYFNVAVSGRARCI